MPSLNRRNFLTSVAAGALVAAAGPALAGPATPLLVGYREIVVKGRSKQVFGLQQPDGAHGLILGPGERFRVALASAIRDPVLIHWHGQEPPASQDGVPELSQHPLPPGTVQIYDFVPRPGTHWMHSHLGFQEQDLLAAPLIVRSAEEMRADVQEVVVMLHDFTFETPESILAGLGGLSGSDPHAGHHAAVSAPAADPMAGMDHSMHMMPSMTPAPTSAPPPPAANPHAGHDMSGGAMDLNDVNFDAYLANDRTLDDPQVVRVESGGRVRLRLINASAQTNFFIDTGTLEAEAIAVDGNPIQPLRGRRFPLAIAQRLDLLLVLPAGAGAWPILAQREGAVERTGIVLATAGGAVTRLGDTATDAAGPLADDNFEHRLTALAPLAARAPDRRVTVKLTGTMSPYVWSLSGHESGENLPIEIRSGERVEFALRNDSPMAHPVHLHGHHFQVTGSERDGRRTRFLGALRDTVLVAPQETVTIEFDATNPGRWAFHCHMLYHQLTGMMGEVRYIA